MGLNVLMAGLLFWVNMRYGLLAKLERVWLEEGRVSGFAPRHELNRNYQVRRELFRMDRNQAARVLFLGDSHVALVDWTALLGEPLVAPRGIEGDTTAGVLTRLNDEAGFRGDTAIVWIGTNDVLQGEPADKIAGRVSQIVEDLYRAHARGIRVVVLAVPPVAQWVEDARARNRTVAETNERLAAAAGQEGYRFISTEDLLADGAGFLRGDMTSDGVHLSAAAYSGIVALLRPALETPPVAR